MLKYALSALVLAAFVTPALSADKFYVVRDTATKECSVVHEKPTVSTMKQVGTAHNTQAKAEKTMKLAKMCDAK